MKKKIISIIFTIVFVTSSFATSVSDDDGSAFITKAEFDALKSSFQSKIDNYNTSIDSKIDEAIASYLTGLVILTQKDLRLDANCLYTFPLIMDADDNWNDRRTNYYSVSSPSFQDKVYTFVGDWVTHVGTGNFWIGDGSVLESQKINKYSYAYQKADMVGMSIKDLTIKPVSGFLFSVGDTNGTRTISGGTYDTRPRLTCGYGFDSVVFLSDGYSTGSGSGINVNDGNTSTTAPSAFAYTNQIGWGRTATYTGGVWDMYLTNPDKWTLSLMPMGSSTGNGSSAIRRFPVSDFGNTYDSYQAKVNSIGAWTGGTGSVWSGTPAPVAYTNPPVSNLFNWDVSGKQTRVYSGNANVPAEKLGDWCLTPDTKGLAKSSRFREILLVDNSIKYAMGWNTDSSKEHYARPWFAYKYFIIPYWSAADNVQKMPPNGTAFSKLPASLVYYIDSNGKKHFLDEGMYLQTFDDDGTVEIELKFGTGTVAGTPKIDIMFSKKPFDANFNPATDILPVKVGATTYSSAYTLDTSVSKSVSFSIENINKNDMLYLNWEPETAGDYCQLDDISKFQIVTQ